jgi:hypothetical protein
VGVRRVQNVIYITNATIVARAALKSKTSRPILVFGRQFTKASPPREGS